MYSDSANNMMKYKKKMQDLVQKLRYWEYFYYIKNESIVSDAQYDATLMELHALERTYPNLLSKNSPTRYINSTMQKYFSKILHKTPMLSLNSITQESQLFLFDKRIKIKLNNNDKILYCCELKIDGIAVSLLYEKGKLIYAATRGDGRHGEDVTNNVCTISTIPIFLSKSDHAVNALPDFLEIRGEVFISKLCFLELNKKIVSQGYKPFSNPRNAASGSLRQLDHNITATRPLSFYCYGVSYFIGKSEIFSNSHWKRLQICKRWGLPINGHICIAHGITDVLKYYSYIHSIRSNLQFDIDGVVIKVDNCTYQDTLSFGSKAPNWAIAYKFPAKIKHTRVVNVVFQVGKTGAIVPVAYLEPVVINNVIIKKVSIHNINVLEKLGLMLGDTVCVQRAGDVIPKILRVIVSKRFDHDVKMIEIPKSCPVCNSILKTWHGGAVLHCAAGLSCSAQRKAWLKHFVSRKAMNIRGMGNKVVNQLVERGLVKYPVDFFNLSKKKLLCLDGYDTKSAERLLKSIENAKIVTLAQFIYALGIRNVGEVIATNLAVEYKMIENLIVADFQSLSKLKYIGHIAAYDVYSFFKNVESLKYVKDLIDPIVGIKFSAII